VRRRLDLAAGEDAGHEPQGGAGVATVEVAQGLAQAESPCPITIASSSCMSASRSAAGRFRADAVEARRPAPRHPGTRKSAAWVARASRPRATAELRAGQGTAPWSGHRPRPRARRSALPFGQRGEQQGPVRDALVAGDAHALAADRLRQRRDARLHARAPGAANAPWPRRSSPPRASASRTRRGLSDCIPSLSARSGSGCTSMISPSAPQATAARPSAAPRCGSRSRAKGPPPPAGATPA